MPRPAFGSCNAQLGSTVQSRTFLFGFGLVGSPRARRPTLLLSRRLSLAFDADGSGLGRRWYEACCPGSAMLPVAWRLRFSRRSGQLRWPWILRVGAVALLVGTGAVLSDCGDESIADPIGCNPGAVISCSCPASHIEGKAVCNPVGSGYGPCVCPFRPCECGR